MCHYLGPIDAASVSFALTARNGTGILDPGIASSIPMLEEAEGTRRPQTRNDHTDQEEMNHEVDTHRAYCNGPRFVCSIGGVCSRERL